jgi:hypothetical protein
MRGIPFHFEMPVSFFEKASAKPGKQRRIGGIVTTDAEDRHGEEVDQSGIEWDEWLSGGWYNDNHSRDTDGVVGYPEKVERYRKGQELPNGQNAPADCHWAEGYMLGTDRANRIWELGKNLQGTGRRLGYSVEGVIKSRTGPRTVLKKGPDGREKWVGKRVAKALVRNVAITSCPVNTEAGMEILQRSLQAAEQSDPDDIEARLTAIEKTLSMGPAPPGGTVPAGPVTGEGAGQIITGQSLEHGKPRKLIGGKNRKCKKGSEERSCKSLTNVEASLWAQNRCPGMTSAQAERFVSITKALKRAGRL